MQNIVKKTKTYSLPIKITLPEKRTFKSSSCVTDFTVPLANFIRSEPFDTLHEDISLPYHRALHLDHSYL